MGGTDANADYDQYYASLAASAAPSGLATPRLSDFGEEEEDVKPNVEYLDSLNENRKRSRSREDVGNGSASPKQRRTSPPEAVPSIVNGVELDSSTLAPAADDDPMVYGESLSSSCRAVNKVDVIYVVNGEPVPFSLVTEEHQEAMTPEEYTAYYEVMTARS